jgi:hypothetical protein
MLRWFVTATLGVLAFVYLFIILIDPWGMLPLALPWPRVPISTNARFSMPALASARHFDSAVIGSSSSRLLRPEVLDKEFGGHFANLAMNAATAWEQRQMLGLFTRTHPAARTVVIGVDNVWCETAPNRLSGRPFPEWMYDRSHWRGYREMANLYAVQESASQLWVMLGFKKRRYGMDGYTSFVPPESAYDPARVAAGFARWGLPPNLPAAPGPHVLPALPMLADALRDLPTATRKIIFFTPAYQTFQGAPGSDYAATFADCKAQIADIARTVPGTTMVDFLIPSPMTSDMAHYWDPVHYRVPIADRIMADLAGAVAGRQSADAKVLVQAQ